MSFVARTECDLVRNMHIDKSSKNVLLLLVIACGFRGIPGLLLVLKCPSSLIALHLCVLLLVLINWELERGMSLCVR